VLGSSLKWYPCGVCRVLFSCMLFLYMYTIVTVVWQYCVVRDKVTLFPMLISIKHRLSYLISFVSLTKYYRFLLQSIYLHTSRCANLFCWQYDLFECIAFQFFSLNMLQHILLEILYCCQDSNYFYLKHDCILI